VVDIIVARNARFTSASFAHANFHLFKENQSTNVLCVVEHLSKVNPQRKADSSSILAKNLLLWWEGVSCWVRIYEDIFKVR
jgi:hypothetical protein